MEKMFTGIERQFRKKKKKAKMTKNKCDTF